MKTIILKELKAYKRSEIAKTLDIFDDELEIVLEQMFRNKIAKQVISNNDYTLEELSEITEYIKPSDLNQHQLYVFTYVGIVIIRNTCLIIYPKYLNNYLEDQNNDFKLMKQILAVIRKYKSKEQFIKINDITSNHESFNYLSTAYEIINDYEINGPYITEKQITEINGQGEILWDKTILESNMVLSHNNPIYLDLFTQNSIANQEDYFYQLHTAVVAHASHQIKDVANILELPNNLLNSAPLESFGDADYIALRVNQEFTRQFVTTRINTLNLIKRYIEQSSAPNSNDELSFVGTSSFNLVWEDVCATVLKDCKQHTMRELGLTSSKLTLRTSVLAQVISSPKWTHHDSGAAHNASKTYIPDIVNIQDNQLSIFDAKYYNIELNEKELKNQPGIESLTKQYMYELAFQEFATENKLIIAENAFVFPNATDEEIKLGTASLDFFQAMGLKDINIILKPCRKMFEDYLQR